MSRIKIALWSLLILAVIIIGGFFYKLRPQYLGKTDVIPVRDSTEVLFDQFGIPHIYASNEYDAYATLGYVHAQERLFQMEMMRRVGSGTLSEILGSQTLEADRLFRTLGIHRKSEYTVSKLSNNKNTPWYTISQAYLDGVNSFVKNGPRPLEFNLLGIPDREYNMVDMHDIAGFMAFNFDRAFTDDPLYTLMRDQLGDEYMRDLHLDYEEGSYVVPVFPPLAAAPESGLSSARKAVEDLSLPSFYGSNSWVIAPSHSENGKVLFANDTHIGYAQPSTWYEAHIEYPGFGFYGNYIAGVPFALVGHSRRHSWGATMFLNDDLDFFCEKLNQDKTSYYFKGVERKMTVRQEVIQVKDSGEVIIDVRSTHHGPLVTDCVGNITQGDELSCSWVFLETETRLMEAFYKMSRAGNMEEARLAASLISAPGLNLSYGDAEGNVGLWAAAKLLERPDHVDSKFILNGYNGEDEYLGYVPFDDNPHLENPPWGFVYSCNNAHYDSSGVEYPGYYEPDDRASVVAEKLAARTDWTVEAMKKLVTDSRSIEHRNISRDLLQIMTDYGLERLQEEERTAIRQLKEWDGEHRIEELGPAIHYRWVYNILKATMTDELGEARFETLLKTNTIKSSIKELICHEESVWWDDIRTEDVKENRNSTILEAFKLTIEQMTTYYGRNPEEWTWGAFHKTKHKHLFDGQAVDWIVNVGPFPSPGGIETVNNSMFYLSDEEEIYAQHGAQMRILIDFSDPENSLSISPTGQSGVVVSSHYADQAEMYLKGAFRPQHMNRDRIEKESTRLVVIPSKK